MTDWHSSALSASAHGTRSLPSRVHAYLEAIVQMGAAGEFRLVSVILFGSAVTGGFSGAVSDVDLIFVLPDGASSQDRHRLREHVARLEILHGIRKEPARPPGPLEMFFDRLTANVRTFFVCTRGDLLSGEVERILDISPFQAACVDRVVVPSIVGSGVTIWGEDLLPRVPLAPLRRRDVFKALAGLSFQVLLCIAAFPLLRSATKYAMGAMKRSVHNCFFCYHAYPAPLEDEVAFFQRLGRMPGRRVSTKCASITAIAIALLTAAPAWSADQALGHGRPDRKRSAGQDLTTARCLGLPPQPRSAPSE